MYSQTLCMNLIVVSKEDIEAPWRSECEHLQSLIISLQNRPAVNDQSDKVLRRYI